MKFKNNNILLFFNNPMVSKVLFPFPHLYNLPTLLKVVCVIRGGGGS